METAKHFEEDNEDVARHALGWRRTKTGRQRARRVGSGGTRPSLPTVQEEKACDAFLKRIEVDEPDEFERRRLDGSTIFTSTLRSLIWASRGTRSQLHGVRSNSLAGQGARSTSSTYAGLNAFNHTVSKAEFWNLVRGWCRRLC
eukprot:3271279-Amphidinium_carterae.1